MFKRFLMTLRVAILCYLKKIKNVKFRHRLGHVRFCDMPGGPHCTFNVIQCHVLSIVTSILVESLSCTKHCHKHFDLFIVMY